MRVRLTILILFLASSLQAQSFYRLDYKKNYVAYGFGMSGYYGDLQHQLIIPDVAATFEFSQRLSHHLKLRESLTLYEIHAEDSEQVDDDLVQRNLSFKSRNVELALILEIRLFKRYERARISFLNPYVFFGAGITTVNPTTNIDGDKYTLRKYRTEGVKYSGIAPVFPVGLGLEVVISKNVSFFSEFGIRATGSDYLDDVSTVYADIDPTEEVRYQLADRSMELGFSRRSPGSQRGGDKRDVYTMVMFKLQYLLHRNFWRNSR